MGEEQIGIGLLGIGVIGSGVARNLQDREEAYAQQTGLRLRLRRVLERDLWKAEGAGVDPAIVTDDPPPSWATRPSTSSSSSWVASSPPTTSSRRPSCRVAT